ncbi:OmpA family protein [Sinimarinibacterium thermocellulolyticum]|uniref:OmpA family protein n=1 Tax=Sinimarinibacterium thermocellulolyticum TaxID=3170016 RepID=A0ABV2A9R3_9GAMM
MRKMLIPAAAAALLWSGVSPAVAVTDDGIPYLGTGYLHEFGDDSRDSDNGDGFEVRLGWPLGKYGYDNLSIEGLFHALRRDRDIDGNPDYQRGLMVDLVYDFGLYGWGSDASTKARFKPFVLAGLGVVQEDVRGDEHEHFGINLGGGLLIPLNWHDLAARFEARVLAQDNDDSVQGEDRLIDYRLGLGLQLPLSFLFPTSAPVVPPADECAIAVVDPITGRSDCGLDSDRDGVLDGLDECPATPSGSVVDARGCTLDLGSDADNDGVPNDADRCPETPAGAQVDALGCVVAQTLVLRGVNFENDSAVLTPESREILDGVADSLKSQPNLRVEIGGHTDSIGNDTYNDILSRQRAEAVRQYLIARGVAADRLVAMGYGEFKPIDSNETAEGRAKNRRVEFKLIVE